MQPGREVGEHVQLRIQRCAGIEIGTVFAFPPEGLSLLSLQSGSVYTFAAQISNVLLRKVLPDDGYHADIGKIACRNAEIGGGSTQNFIAPSERRLDRIQHNRSHNQYSHSFPVPPEATTSMVRLDICRRCSPAGF
jgi:hypothetical protein